MANQQELIYQLQQRLETLSEKHEAFKHEIFKLKNQIDRLQAASNEQQRLEVPPSRPQSTSVEQRPVHNQNRAWEDTSKQQLTFNGNSSPEQQSRQSQHNQPYTTVHKSHKLSPLRKSNLEKFIGENLLNKIGILILLIGIGIGAKYSIENELISPLTRIILGYFSAIGLLGFGIKLKKKYEAYSAVLVSGAIVTLYFITYFAYSFYELIPQNVAFVLMVLFTGFTIVASLNYNRQIIAHLGLVGAYAVPFLLSNDSGRVEILFSYISIINIGILILSFKKNWKPLYYSAFGLTWLIYLSWFIMDYNNEDHFLLALGFLLLFFVIFYLTFLAYKLVKKDNIDIGDIILLFLNSFIFFGLGYAILNGDETEHYLGLFTLANAVIHFIVAAVIYKQNLSDKKLFYFATALVLAFIAIAIPVQLDGNWVTLFWTALAVLLFWLGTTKKISIYEKLSYPLMALAFLSIVHDWAENYDVYYADASQQLAPLFNINFASSILFALGFGFILYVQRKESFESVFKKDSIWLQMALYAVPVIFLLSLYYAFRLEIEQYWDQLLYNSRVDSKSSTNFKGYVQDYSLIDFKAVWVLNFTLTFIAILGFINFKKIKNRILEIAVLVLTLIALLVFLVQGLYSLSELREAYLEPSDYYNRGMFYIGIRYISFVALALVIIPLYRFIKKDGTARGFKIAYDIILHVTIVWVVSSELIHWLDIAGARDSYKLGLSILWGVYSFLLIGFGIWKNKPYLRIGGMVLFGITLIKLFFYDLTELNTISKTIVFVSLGLLLLIISFLYNKYKNQINYNESNKELPQTESQQPESEPYNEPPIDKFDDRNDP